MTGIAAAGGYVPRFRLPTATLEEAWGQSGARGIEQTAVPDGDEDALTMGYEAASRALEVADRDGGSVARLHFGTSTPPLAESELTARLCSMLGLPNAISTATYTGSTRAGLQALAGALDGDETALVVAADCPRGEPESRIEHAAGAGGAALLLTPDGGVRVDDRVEYVTPFPGTRFRRPGDAVTKEVGLRRYERKAYRETLGGAIDRLDAEPSAVAAAAIQAPDGDLPRRLASRLGITDEALDAGLTVEQVGDLGAASVPLGLIRALHTEADSILLGGYGSGGAASAFLLERDAEIPSALALDGDIRLTYPGALRRRGHLSGADVAGGGAHVSFPSWRESLPQRHRLEAGACQACGALDFPPGGACPDCGARRGYEAVKLGPSGIIDAATTIHTGGAPPEFAEQQSRTGPYDSAIVAVEGPEGQTVRVPLQVVLAGDESLAIGDRVVTTVRRLYEEEGVPRYGQKAVLQRSRR
jgi:hydroxymethylglutaryl-CoA synthase